MSSNDQQKPILALKIQGGSSDCMTTNISEQLCDVCGTESVGGPRLSDSQHPVNVPPVKSCSGILVLLSNGGLLSVSLPPILG